MIEREVLSFGAAVTVARDIEPTLDLEILERQIGGRAVVRPGRASQCQSPTIAVTGSPEIGHAGTRADCGRRGGGTGSKVIAGELSGQSV